MVLSVALLALLLPGVADTMPELRRCGTPQVPLGVVRSVGTAAFTVTRKGVADTGSLAILEMERGTPAGLRSALVRQLPSCRFRAARDGRRDADQRVVARIHFDRDTLRLEMLEAITAESRGARADEPVTVAEDTLAGDDQRLEELPRRVSCRLVARDEIVTKVRVDGRIVDNPPIPMPPPPDSRSRLSPGEALLAFVVPVNGQVEAGDISVLRSSSGAHATAGRDRISTCRWAPGRVAGTPVPVRVVGLERFH